MNIVQKRILSCVCILIGLAAVHAGYIVFDGLHDEIGHADAIVVLGRGNLSRDENVLKELHCRLDTAYDLYRKGFGKKIVVSGDGGKVTPETTFLMRNYLIARKGTPENNIISFNDAFDTYATAYAVRRLVEKEQWKSVLIVSPFYHMTRCKLAFRKAGLQKLYFVHAKTSPTSRDFYSLLREIPALYYYFSRRYPA